PRCAMGLFATLTKESIAERGGRRSEIKGEDGAAVRRTFAEPATALGDGRSDVKETSDIRRQRRRRRGTEAVLFQAWGRRRTMRMGCSATGRPSACDSWCPGES